MHTRSKAKAELAAQFKPADSCSAGDALDVHLANEPPPKALEMGFKTGTRKRQVEGGKTGRPRNPLVNNRIHLNITNKRRTGRGSSNRNAGLRNELDPELRVLGKRKRKMRGPLRKNKLVELGRGDYDIDPSMNAADDFSRGDASQRIQGSLAIGSGLEEAVEKPESRPMTAKMRWKDRARSINNENEADPPTPTAVRTPDEELDVSQPSNGYFLSADLNPPCQNSNAATLSKEQRHQIDNPGNPQQIQERRKSKVTKQRSVKAKRLQKARKRRMGILKKVKSWASQAKFLQKTLESNGNSTEATEWTLVMTENDRENFVQKMVKQCQNNRELRSSFLDSVKKFVNSGLMHSAAVALLDKGPCEEAQEVVKAWENFKLQQSAGKELPMDLLNAVAELHDKRKDLAAELARFEGSESLLLRQIHDGTWQLQISNYASTEKASLS